MIVGNSAAGTAAAETIRQIDPGGAITIISEENCPAYSRPLTTHLIAGELTEKELFYRPADFYETNGIELILGQQVVAIFPGEKKVRLQNGHDIPYDRLLLATGAEPTRPAWPGSEHAFTIRTLEDARAIMNSGARTAVVLGGGLAGLKVAEALNRRGLRVHTVVKSPHLLSRQLDSQGAAILEEAAREQGLDLIFNQDATEIKATGGRVEAVILEDGRQLTADLVIAAKGVRPRTELLREAGGRVGQGILVDDHLETSIPHVYAAGDVAEVWDTITGRRLVSAVWPSAVEQGKIAGSNMAGEKRVYGGTLMPFNAGELFGVPLVSLGLTVPPPEGYQVLSDYRPEERKYRKIVLKGDIVVGAILVGEIDRAGVLTTLMRQKIALGEQKKRLSRRALEHSILLGSLF